MAFNSRGMNVLVCTDLSRIEPHRSDGDIREPLGGVIVCTLPWNVRHVGSIPTLATIFPVFITAHDIAKSSICTFVTLVLT